MTEFMIIIQALRAENVPYVVAPYEADAQMAYLEATGVVQAILTEDSDLLVFGAKTLLLKLDATAASVTSISHSELGAALPGWTHARFRSMAILSGCDYLPSLPGVGLKTAKTWLAAHGTTEKALAAARLAGKTRVSPGYMEQFNRAEAVFLHQRVYDPVQECLIHLSPPTRGVEFDADTDAYIGRLVMKHHHIHFISLNTKFSDLEADLAARIARGDACPISLRPMVDINPGYVPRPIGMPKPLAMTNMNTKTPYSAKGKGKAAATPSTGASIARFLVPVAKAANQTAQPGPSRLPPPAVGARSGKRTLATLADDETTVLHSPGAVKRPRPTHSRFFTPPPPRPRTPVSPRKNASGKENMPVRQRTRSDASEMDLENIADEGDSIDNITALSMLPLPPRSPRALPTPSSTPEDDDVPWDSLPDPGKVVVIQEDGYLSPPPTMSDDEGDELSSPVRPRIVDVFAGDGGHDGDADEGWVRALDFSAFRHEAPRTTRREPKRNEYHPTDVLSSPPRSRSPVRTNGAVLVPASPARGDVCSDIEDGDEPQDVPIAAYDEDEDEFLQYSDSAPERDLSDGPIDDPWLVEEEFSTPHEPNINQQAVAAAWIRKFSYRSDSSGKHTTFPPLRRAKTFEQRVVHA